MNQNTNPFDDTSRTINGTPCGERHGTIVTIIDGINKSYASPSGLSSVFPAWMSSWMKCEEGDDESLYHECLMDISSSSSLEDESTSLLVKTSHHNNMTTSQSLSPLRAMPKSYAATCTTPASNSSLSSIQQRRRSSGASINSGHDVTINAAINHEESNYSESIVSPFAQALATWLSPYADSAKRAGRNILQSSDEPIADEDAESCADERSNLLTKYNNVADEKVAGKDNRVRFHPDYNGTENDEDNRECKSNLGSLSRVNSSPALMTAYSNETKRFNLSSAQRGQSTIVLKDIIAQGENNYSEDSTVIHPWTKLILLEELGTAWSWFVLLLPYAFMILAIILDGNTTLKNTHVGPLRGNITCAEIVDGAVTTPYDVSVKGYFPVPFRLDGLKGGSNQTAGKSATFPRSCTYPFELRAGVGLLSHGTNGAESNVRLPPSSSSSNTPKKTTIINARYRYLMSHGHAFTTSIIPNVPPTSQSLQGSVKFNNLSSSAVALVARGSVVVSVIVFQRPTPTTNQAANNMTSFFASPATVKQWSPVLILTSKRLDMVCKLNGVQSGHETTPLTQQNSTWSCSCHRIIDAFFSLPNTAVLMGGDLRVDVLLSHHNNHKSLAEDLWFNERGGIMRADDDYTIHGLNDSYDLSVADKILSSANISSPQDLLAELSTKSVYRLEHESVAYNIVVEVTRIFSLTVTMLFLFYWWWSMGVMNEGSGARANEEGTTSTGGTCSSLVYRFLCSLSHMWERSQEQTYQFWWQDPWITFPERRYLLLLLFCLVVFQNPLLVYAFFHPSLYSSAKFRFAADSLSGISVHGILFLWLCLVHGLRYHTADIGRRRFDQHQRVLELKKATGHISPTNKIEDNQWGMVKWYYQQYGDFYGVGTAHSMALRMKHDNASDSFVEFMFPKMSLLVIGIVSSVTAAASRFPMSESSDLSEREELNPDRFGSGSKVYVTSSIVQLVVIQIWCLFIVYTSFITGERLRREPFLSTRPAQLAFRVLSGIVLLGFGFSISLFFIHSLNLVSNENSTSANVVSENEVTYDTSEGNAESLDSMADILLNLIRHMSAIPYVGTASNIGPGKILYATACSLVVAFLFLPSSHFHPTKKEQRTVEEIAMGPDQYSKQTILAQMDKSLQGKDKRFVVPLCRNTHTWRVFPLPTRSHGLMSQHTLKETLHMVGTFQLQVDACGHFVPHNFKFGRGAIYKGRYIPVFCVEIACWLLEASWQAYYSPTEYSLSEWAPGRMRLDSIGLKLEYAINNSETDTHAFVASNVSEQVEGEEDSIIVVSFRGSASMSNIKTDLSFRQVPLPEQIMSDIPAFSIKPGMPIGVDENLWNRNECSSPSIIQDIIRRPYGKYKCRGPTTATERSNDDNVDIDPSLLIPTVSTGAKAIIRATPMARQALPCVHEGFLQNYSKVRHETIEAVLSVFKRQLDKSVERSRQRRSPGSLDAQPLTLPKLYITGHSMGGTLAQLLALDLASNVEIVIEQTITEAKNQSIVGSGAPSRQSLSSLDNDEETEEASSDTGDMYWLGQKLTTPTKKIRLRPPVAVYTYGQSRLGNKAFKTIYKKRVPHTFRVATEGDAITAMPTVGPFCGGVYRHAGLEVLLEEGCTGNILVGPTSVETLLRFTKVRTSMAAHSMDRYRESLESALGRDELKEYYRGHGGKVRHDNQGVYSGNGARLPSWVTNVKRSHDHV
mmetsp:Transcript_18045/g.43378  ORF Transcript_18045/g.43378 Transcript_18045/m.43378 type:complete len:1693 (+) Transcript_18045:233-5311(+)